MNTRALTALIIFAFSALSYAGPERLGDNKDMKQVAVPETCPINWTGFYVGGHGGYGFNGADTSFIPLPSAQRFFDLAPTTLDPDSDGFFGGIQLGYNRQMGAFVVGLETDFSGSTMDGTKNAPLININGLPVLGGAHITAHQDTNWFGTVRGRVGFTPVCRLLLYGTGGLAYGDVHYSANVDTRTDDPWQYPASSTETKLGWTAGAGGELALTRRWSIKLEFLYYDLGDETFIGNPIPPNPPFQVRYVAETTAYTVNGGLNFKF